MSNEHSPSIDITRRVNAMSWVDARHTIQPTCIVLHWWGEPIIGRGVDSLIEVLERRGLSVQFTVLVTGEIVQLSPSPTTFCRHAKCANESGIGIEIEGHNENDLDANTVQYASVVKLVSHLKRIYDIEDNFRVVTKADMTIFHGIASHKLVDMFCKDANGKDDVHDDYLRRVRRDVEL